MGLLPNTIKPTPYNVSELQVLGRAFQGNRILQQGEIVLFVRDVENQDVTSKVEFQWEAGTVVRAPLPSRSSLYTASCSTAWTST
jgi:hypothetical protein